MTESVTTRKSILAVFAHPDDELGCLGTLASHAARGDRVVLAWTTLGEMTSAFNDLPPPEVARTRGEHAQKVGGIIGCEVRLFDWGDTKVTVTREHTIELAKLIAEVHPQGVITFNPLINFRPGTSGYRPGLHPDHLRTSQVVFDALHFARLPKLVAPLEAYREPVSTFVYSDGSEGLPAVYVDVSDHFEQVLAVARMYADSFLWPQVENFVRERLERVGRECGVKAAERFGASWAKLPAVRHLL